MNIFKILVLSFCLSLFSSSSFAASGTLKPYSGKLTNPQFKLTDMHNEKHSLSEYQGNIVLVQFWATYCSPCRKEMPTMNSLLKKMEGKPFKIVTINMAEDKQTIENFLKEVKVDFPVFLDSDGSTINQWKVFAAPANFILDKKGKIIYTLFGGIDWNSDEMVKKLSELTAM